LDRIPAVGVNGSELLRASTQEPDRRNGVEWDAIKDITPYYDVVARGGQVVIALDNVIAWPYTSFTITLTAEFYKPRTINLRHALLPDLGRPDLVIPVSKSPSTYGWFMVEPKSVDDGANSAIVQLPRNMEEV
jgi:hypothetical protein